MNFVYFYYDDFKIDYCFEYKYENIYIDILLYYSNYCMLLIKRLFGLLNKQIIKIRRLKCHLKLKQRI